MQTHPRIGYDILKGSPSKYLSMGAIIALGHHEKFDGTGYPNGLHGEDIPIVARVVAVADVFDALVSERPYKHAWPMRRRDRLPQGAARQALRPEVRRRLPRRPDEGRGDHRGVRGLGSRSRPHAHRLVSLWSRPGRSSPQTAHADELQLLHLPALRHPVGVLQGVGRSSHRRPRRNRRKLMG